jgi:GNAT superfamily N-acetyltransferase
MTEITIRQATEADAEALAGLMTELGSVTTPEDMAHRLAEIRRPSNVVALVAIVDETVAGVIGLSVSPSFVRNTPHGQIIALVVAARFRRRGIGRALIGAAEDWFRRQGVERISLTSGLHRASDAHAFYRACGYEHTGLRFVRHL